MFRFLIVFIVGIFLIYICVYSYKFLRHRKESKILMRFMTSCMLLFTFTIVFYENIFFNNNVTNEEYIGLSAINESNVFISSHGISLEDEKEKVDAVNKQEIEAKITAYFDNASPGRGSITNLIVTGPPKGRVTAICQYKGHGTPYIMPIGVNGLAVIPILVDSDAEPGLLVVVDITVSYNGKQYKLNSVFTPQ